MDYRIEKIISLDEPLVNKFLETHFFQHEPLNVAIRNKMKTVLNQENYPYVIYSNIANGLSLKAVDSEDNIVGVILNTTKRNGFEILHRQMIGCAEYMNEVLDFLKYVDELSNCKKLLERHGDDVLDMKIISVAVNQRKKGIANRLIEESIKLAKEHNYSAISIGCSSNHTSQLIEHKFPQFNLIFSYPYENYVDSQGDIVFDIPAPHLANRIYVYEVHKGNM